MRRILIIDDNVSVHQQMTRILENAAKGASPSHEKLEELHHKVFGTAVPTAPKKLQYQIASAFSGKDGFEMVKKAQAENMPYAMAIVDMRMPPGWDGLETIKKIWQVAPHTQILICTAFSDYSWTEINRQLEYSDAFLILKKPFDVTELEQMAAAMTTKWLLTQEKEKHMTSLSEAKLAAESGLMAKRNFLALMNHEFRTPINVIMGAFNLTKGTKELPGEIHQIIGGAEHATRDLLAMLDDVVDYLDIEHGMIRLTEDSYNLNTLIQKTSLHYKGLAESHNIFMILEEIPGICDYLGDQRRIRQVLSHLLSNAIKHTKDGEIKVRAVIHPGADPDVDLIEILVKDSGEGIPQESLESIFDFFHQGEEPLYRHTKGIGLGLSICRLVLISMGGSISVTSKLDQGTEFKVRFTQKRSLKAS